MDTKKTTFALYLGNRGMFPGSLMAGAREDMVRVLKGLGHDVLMLDESATRYGAVETPEEGRIFAEFLHQNKGNYGGVILCLPNFGDENGAMAAFRDVDVPIFVQAYPDDMDKMAPDVRRDAFCGKCSITDVFYQSGVKFTALKPHTVHPNNKRFAENINYFDKVCRIVNGIRNMTVGAIGARCTAFKTVRIDEVALQRNGINMEVFDLSDVFKRIDDTPENAAFADKKQAMLACASWKGVPDAAISKLVRTALVFDKYIEECKLDAVAIRCWDEFERILGISPCVVLGHLNDRLITAACEVDVGNAVAMRALGLASYKPTTCLDWNNNYGDDDDKCILFHCGPVPPSLMAAPGCITPHAILGNIVSPDCTYGCNQGRMAPGPFSFASMMTWEGKPRFFGGTGEFTADPIPVDFFGCAGVAHIRNLQDVLLHVAHNGYRHHVSITPGDVIAPMREALGKYLGFEMTVPQGCCC